MKESIIGNLEKEFGTFSDKEKLIIIKTLDLVEKDYGFYSNEIDGLECDYLSEWKETPIGEFSNN